MAPFRLSRLRPKSNPKPEAQAEEAAPGGLERGTGGAEGSTATLIGGTPVRDRRTTLLTARLLMNLKLGRKMSARSTHCPPVLVSNPVNSGVHAGRAEWSGAGAERSGVVRSGAEWCGVVRSGAEWCGVMRSGAEWCGVKWRGVEWNEAALSKWTFSFPT